MNGTIVDRSPPTALRRPRWPHGFCGPDPFRSFRCYVWSSRSESIRFLQVQDRRFPHAHICGMGVPYSTAALSNLMFAPEMVASLFGYVLAYRYVVVHGSIRLCSAFTSGRRAEVRGQTVLCT